MTVCVDEMREYPSGRWCHMLSDQEDLTELHEMATRIGLKRGWFQGRDPRHPHYDLRATKRIQAISLGAIEVTDEEMIRRCVRKEKNESTTME